MYIYVYICFFFLCKYLHMIYKHVCHVSVRRRLWGRAEGMGVVLGGLDGWHRVHVLYDLGHC